MSSVVVFIGAIIVALAEVLEFKDRPRLRKGLALLGVIISASGALWADRQQGVLDDLLLSATKENAALSRQIATRAEEARDLALRIAARADESANLQARIAEQAEEIARLNAELGTKADHLAASLTGGDA